jgi:tetratricopeptide (TPR) repeat protein
LTGKLSVLKRYNALPVPVEFFLEAMSRLREKRLNVALESVPRPASAPAQQAAEAQQAIASAAPEVGKAELTAQDWFERGFDATDHDEEFRCFSQAIRLKPDFAEAYINRGYALAAKGDHDGALKDYTEAIRLKPDFAEAYNNRGIAHDEKGDFDGAIEDYTEAIRLKPDNANAYYNRGVTRRGMGGPASAKTAIADFQKYLDLGGSIRDGDQAKVEGFIRDLKKKL